MNKKIFLILTCLLMSFGLFGVGGEVKADAYTDCLNRECYGNPPKACDRVGNPPTVNEEFCNTCKANCRNIAPEGSCPTVCGSLASTVPDGRGGSKNCDPTPACATKPGVGTTAVDACNNYCNPTTEYCRTSDGTCQNRATDECQGYCSATEECINGSCQNKGTGDTNSTKGNVPNPNANSGSGGDVVITDPLSLGANPIPTLAKRLIMAALGLTGVLALLSFIYGGILYMLVGVNADNVKKGKEVMKWSVVGLFVIFSSYAILNFILGTVLGVK